MGELELSKTSASKGSVDSQGRVSNISKSLTSDNCDDIKSLTISFAKVEAELESCKAELEKIRPNSDEVAFKCNGLGIDPAIATVPHLLDLLKTSRTQNSALQAEVQDKIDKLYQTTHVLEQQKLLCSEMKTRLRSIDTEDARRRASYVSEISKFYESKMQNIEHELTEKGVRLEEDFWTPHADTSSMHDFLSKVMEHKDEVAEEELRREVSNAGTDHFSDDEPVVFPVQGFRESIANEDRARYLADPEFGAAPRSGDRARQGQAVKAKTCVLQ